MDFFKNYCGAMDRQIERKRRQAEYNKLENLEDRKAWWLANREQIIAEYPRVKPDYLQWDYEPSGYQGEINGEFSA